MKALSYRTVRPVCPGLAKAVYRPLPKCRRSWIGHRRLDHLTSLVRRASIDASKLDQFAEKDIRDLSITRSTTEKVVGFLGGGQLGRMAALAAANLGVKVKCLDPVPNAPASVAAEQVIGDFRNPTDILEFAQGCDALTVEIEHVDVQALRKVSQQISIPVEPSPDTIEVIQDKLRQKQVLQSHGIAVAESTEVVDMECLVSICRKRLPVMLKARRLAYDGRGNYVIRTLDDIEGAVESLGGVDSGLYVEEWVPFKKELAVMVAKSVNGEMSSYPVTETIHKNSICYVTETPADVIPAVRQRARELAEKAVRCLKGGGIYGVEMFLLHDGQVLVNEIAPRPHNSGHYTIDGCYTSQFEQHIRAILGWPLGDTALMVEGAVMMNLLGEAEGEHGLNIAQSVIERALTIPRAMVHWYQKSNVQKNRKIGHVNIVGTSRDQVRRNLRMLDDEAYAALTKSGEEGDMMDTPPAQVGIIMGSDSDLKTMGAAAEALERFGVRTEVTIVSAHRTPDRMMDYARNAHSRGLKVIIAGAGGAAHLPGMVAAMTPLPVIGVPCVPSGSHLDGLDALMSIVQMPRGVPVATVGIGNAKNAGLLAIRILSITDASLHDALIHEQSSMKASVLEKAQSIETKGWRVY